jgi:hypothetical protein
LVKVIFAHRGMTPPPPPHTQIKGQVFSKREIITKMQKYCGVIKTFSSRITKPEKLEFT